MHSGYMCKEYICAGVSRPEIRSIMDAMQKNRRNASVFPVKPRKAAPHKFVLEALEQIPIVTRSMLKWCG